MIETTKLIGKLVTDPSAQRDAIHIACIPVFVDDQELKPGMRVGLVPGTTDHITQSEDSIHDIGIVDPFLRFPARHGDRVWLFLFPLTVTGMVHRWSHPAFDKPAKAPIHVPE